MTDSKSKRELKEYILEELYAGKAAKDLMR